MFILINANQLETIKHINSAADMQLVILVTQLIHRSASATTGHFH